MKQKIDLVENADVVNTTLEIVSLLTKFKVRSAIELQLDLKHISDNEICSDCGVWKDTCGCSENYEYDMYDDGADYE